MFPILKWAGGKRWLVDVLREEWELQPKNTILLEPFCGGLSVALGLNPIKAVLNDINPSLINLYKHVQDGLIIKEELKNDPNFYYDRRDEFNELIKDEVGVHSERAAILFYYLNRTGFNGLCRFNRKGGYNVPFGKYKSVHYTYDFSIYKPVFEKWTFVNKDFYSVDLGENFFIYADPPYDVDFRDYSKQGFTWGDQEKLALWLSSHKGNVVASNQATPRIIDLYTSLGFTVKTIEAPRRISCNGNRTPAKEILAIKTK